MTEQEQQLAKLIELEKAKAAARMQATTLVIGVVVIVLSFILCF